MVMRGYPIIAYLISIDASFLLNELSHERHTVIVLSQNNDSIFFSSTPESLTEKHHL